jgi:hypothetical protein
MIRLVNNLTAENSRHHPIRLMLFFSPKVIKFEKRAFFKAIDNPQKVIGNL